MNDRKEREQCPEASELEALGVSVICGRHPDDLIHPGVTLLVKNPGIPYSAPPVQKALELKIPVVTEVEIAYHLCRHHTRINRQALESAGLSPIVAGYRHASS